MREYSAFDILGPIMIGPSSSHTAGAARLGKVAKTIADGKIKKVKFFLHGSFASTYKGHGTDKALVAGILGMNPWDEGLKTSMDKAKEKGIEIEFIPTDLGDDVHPNTVKFEITRTDGKIVEVIGSSIGGGNIVITGIDGENIEFTGAYPTILINHVDLPGMVARVSAVLYYYRINIAFMRVYRSGKGSAAAMVFEVDDVISQELIDEIRKIPNIKNARAINPIKEEK